MGWKRAGGRLIYCWGAATRPMGKAVASIRARERLPLFTKKLSGKHMEKVIWSVCKNSSMFPFSSPILSQPGSCPLRRPCRRDGSGRRQSRRAGKPFRELKFHFALCLWESQQHCTMGRQAYCFVYHCTLSALPFGYTHLQQGQLGEIQGI